MWICFNDGFVSVVEDTRGINDLVVRSRRPEILQMLFPTNEIIELDVSDYKYRTYTSREEWAEIMFEKINNIDYSNFKNSVADNELHTLYERMWGLHYNYQR